MQLGKPLQTTCHVYGITNRCDTRRGSCTDQPDKRRADVSTNRYFGWCGPVKARLPAEGSNLEGDRTSRGECLTGAEARPCVQSEEGEHAITEEGVDNAALIFNRAYHNGKKAVQQIESVIRKPSGRERRKPAQINE